VLVRLVEEEGKDDVVLSLALVVEDDRLKGESIPDAELSLDDRLYVIGVGGLRLADDKFESTIRIGTIRSFDDLSLSAPMLLEEELFINELLLGESDS